MALIKRIEGATRTFGAPHDWSGEDGKCYGLRRKERAERQIELMRAQPIYYTPPDAKWPTDWSAS